MHLVEPRGSPRGPCCTSWNLVAHLVRPDAPLGTSWLTSWTLVHLVEPRGSPRGPWFTSFVLENSWMESGCFRGSAWMFPGSGDLVVFASTRLGKTPAIF